jgi:hypothetical protein
MAAGYLALATLASSFQNKNSGYLLLHWNNGNGKANTFPADAQPK